MLSNVDILAALENKDITISPFTQQQLQPASYDILLGNEFMLFDNSHIAYIDPKEDCSHLMRSITVEDDGFIILHPKEFMLGVSYERVGVSAAFSCELMGKSSLARLGLIVHTTAGFIDPGNELRITLEMVNLNTVPLKLYPKMKIAQVAFMNLNTPTTTPYGSSGLQSKYYGSNSVVPSRMNLNWKQSRTTISD